MRVNGVELNLEIVKLDHSTNDPKVEKEAKNLGFTGNLPYYKIFSEDRKDLSQKEQSSVSLSNISFPEVTE